MPPGSRQIWFTRSISTGSLGQGRRVPLQRLPPEFRAVLIQTLDQLAYRQADDQWSAMSAPLDPRADASPTAADAAHDGLEVAAVVRELSLRLAAVPGDRTRAFVAHHPRAILNDAHDRPDGAVSGYATTSQEDRRRCQNGKACSRGYNRRIVVLDWTGAALRSMARCSE